MTTLFETAASEPQPSGEEWDYQFVPALIRGLNSATRPELLQDDEMVAAENVRFDKNDLLVDFGYKKFGAAIRGVPRRTYQFVTTTGGDTHVLVTDATIYVWAATPAEWQYPSDGTKTTVNAVEAGGQTEITVASIAGFSDGDDVGIILDDGTQHKTTVNGVPVATEITITDALPSATGVGKAFVKAVDLVGDPDIQPSLVTWAAVDRLYITNGVDTPKQFDGIDVTDVSNLPGSTFAARVVQVFKDRLLFMHTLEDGTEKPQRVRWSQLGDPTDWNASINVIDLFDREDSITAAEQLGPYMMIYRSESIVRQAHVGLLNRVWDFTPTVDGEGARGLHAVVNMDDHHILFGHQNIYEYRGGFDLTPIGDNVFDTIFSKEGNLDTTNANRVFGFRVDELGEVWFMYPRTGDTNPTGQLKLKLANRAWTTRVFLEAFTGFGFFKATTTKTWNDLIGPWTAQLFKWNSKTLASSAPTVQLLGVDLQVYDYDYIQSEDDAAAIPYLVVTKDFYVPNRFLRFDRFDFELKGTSIAVNVSFDAGSNWALLGTFSPGAVFARQRKYLQIVKRQVRFRFSGSDDFGLRWFGFRYKRETVE